jgi:hypothetical protein
MVISSRRFGTAYQSLLQGLCPTSPSNNSALTEICLHLNLSENKFKKEILKVEVKTDLTYTEYMEAKGYIQHP